MPRLTCSYDRTILSEMSSTVVAVVGLFASICDTTCKNDERTQERAGDRTARRGLVVVSESSSC